MEQSLILPVLDEEYIVDLGSVIRLKPALLQSCFKHFGIFIKLCRLLYLVKRGATNCTTQFIAY